MDRAPGSDRLILPAMQQTKQPFWARLELLYRRHHEAKPRRVVGKLALQVEKISAGDVRRLEAAAPGHRDIGIIAPRWRRLQIGGAVKDPHIARAQLAR
jgi:hypothetical protein